MKTVHKYPLDLDQKINKIGMQRNAKLLTVQVQCGSACVWALVDREEPIVIRHLRVACTGCDMTSSEAHSYVASIQTPDGSMIFHVFDLGESVR
jgi:hypothetical protein